MAKIGLVTHALTTSGGTSRTIVELAKFYREQGFDVTLYACEYAPEKCFPEYLKDFKVVSLRESNPRLAPSYAVWEMKRPTPSRLPVLSMLRSYTRFLSRNSNLAVAAFMANLNHTKIGKWRGRSRVLNRWANSGVRLADVVTDARELVALIDQDTDFLNGIDNNAAEVLFIFRKLHGPRVPLVWTCLDLPVWMELGKDGPTGRSDRRWLGLSVVRREFPLLFMHQRVVRAMDKVIVHAGKNADLVRRVYGRLPKLIFPGVDIEAYKFRAPDDLAKSPFLISSAAVLYPYRRYEDLIRAIALLRGQHDVRLELAGTTEFSPAYHQSLLALIRELQLERFVTWHGRVSEAALADLYGRSTAYVWANHNQSWGCSVFEAMACGTPVIVSRTSGASEMLTDGLDALLVPPLDPAAIAGAIDRLITESGLARRLAERGRETIASLTWRRHCELNLEITQGLLAAKQGVVH